VKPPFSLILLPTLRCNARCEYCFETRTGEELTLDRLTIVVGKAIDHMEARMIDTLSIYWQGGEVLTRSPEWYERAHDLIEDIVAKGAHRVVHYLQTNMIGYGPKWNRVIAGMFGNSVGTSMDFPNLHRRLKRGTPREYQELWERKIREAAHAGIEVGVIALPNEKTFALGAEAFYAYFVEHLGIRNLQVNTPFAGGAPNAVKSGYPLDMERFSAFFSDLAGLWETRGRDAGVRIGPFDALAAYFERGSKELLCIWRENCANEFACVDPSGHVAQCDCWVSGYPEYRFGNILEPGSLSDLLEMSDARLEFQARPGYLMRTEDCLDCTYLAICHGGCPVRAYSAYGTVLRKDPYCDLYKNLFRRVEEASRRHRDVAA
jgi:radical SAM protein with 4Fe4S-binding SPASM domain